MGQQPIEIFIPLQRGDRLKLSESDVYRRQILMTKVDPRAVSIKARRQHVGSNLYWAFINPNVKQDKSKIAFQINEV